LKIKNKYFFLDTFSNAFYAGSKLVFNIVVFSLLVGIFPLNDYGIYIFFATLMTQFEFIQSGFSASLERYIPIYQDKKDISNLISVVAFVYLGFGFSFSLLLFALNYFNIFKFLGDSDLSKFVYLLVCFVPLIWFFKTFSFALRAFKDFRSENLVNCSFLFIEAGLIYYAITHDFKLEEILFINLFILLFRYIMHFLLVIIRHSFNFSLINKKSLVIEFIKVRAYSFWNFISALSGSIVNVSDKLLVSLFLGAASLPIYYGINQFIKFNTTLSSVLNSSIIPHFTNKISKSTSKEFNELALKGTEYTSFVLMTISATFILFSSYIFTLISKDYLLNYTLIFNIGMVLYILIGSRGFITKLYKCRIESNKLISKLNIITSIFYPLVFILLSSLYGLNGAILSPILSHLLIFPIWLYLVFKQTNLKVSRYFKPVLSNFFKIMIVFTPFYLINHFSNKSQDYVLLFFELIIIFMLIYTVFYKLIKKIKTTTA